MNTKLVVTATDECDVAEEARHRTLNQLGFVRGASVEDQWYILVAEGWKETKLPLNETIQYYLVSMLSRFMNRPELLDELSAFNYAPYVFGGRAVEPASAQDVADVSLQYVALFPGRSKYRHEHRSLEYVSNLGASLYARLSKTFSHDDHRRLTFNSMSQSFGKAVLVLRSACPRLHQQAVAQHATEDDVRMPSDEEARVLKRFEAMHLDSEYPPVSKNN